MSARILCALLVAQFAIHAEPVSPDPREAWDLAGVQVALLTLVVAEESKCEQDVITRGWGDAEPGIEVLHGGLHSPYDGVCFPNFDYVDIEHIVARAEADESGLCSQALTVREEFAADLLNLTFAPSSLNASKGKRDAGEIKSADQSKFRDALTPAGKCFWAAQTVRVKSKYDLSVDAAEKAALTEILNECQAAGTAVGRPQASASCGWAVRSEYAQAAQDVALESCSEKPETESWRAALPYASDIACHVEQPAAPVQDDSRADQIAAQTACKEQLDSITCSSIKAQCPLVTVIHLGEPLYQPIRTNGRSNDSDDDGLYCESL